ncbi:hypothetical protein [Chromobacterium amazonense]|uniref:hypothetical protein n=1 Tax=Chromobacterium amazonense TaxID=1382803 RepID=UPI003F7AD7D1
MEYSVNRCRFNAKLISLVSLLMLCLVSNAYASHLNQKKVKESTVAEGLAPDLTKYSKELEAIKKAQRESLVLKQELQAAKLRADLFKETGGMGKAESPYVLTLTGIGSQRKARIFFPGVGEISALPGSHLPGGWQLASIDDDSVRARAPSGKYVQLPFYVQ